MKDVKIEEITHVGKYGDDTHVVRFTESGYETALIVTRHMECYDWEVHEYMDVVDPGEAAEAFSICKRGMDMPYSDYEWPINQSYYWLVRRSNGRLYPWPLLFSSQEERQAAADEYNNNTWEMFYKGHCSSPDIVDCPTSEEIGVLLAQVEAYAHQGGTPWDDLYERGGLTPRWVA